MDLIYITNDIFRARCADEAGVDRVMVDLEINGKNERQGHLNTVISNHNLNDVARVKESLKDSQLLVRVNPLFSGSKNEITSCVERGADILMLPMFKTATEVDAFVTLVAGRTKVCLLLETPQALARAHEILKIQGIDEVHIGLNDLHLGLNLQFMFELLSGGLVDYLSNILKENGLKFGFGGVARLNTGALSANLILSEHLRLGSSQVILSRDFNSVFSLGNKADSGLLFKNEVEKIRSYITELNELDALALNNNKHELTKIVDSFVLSAS